MGHRYPSFSEPESVPGVGRSSLLSTQPALSSPSRTRMARGFLLQIFQFWLTGGDFLVYCVEKDSEVQLGQYAVINKQCHERGTGRCDGGPLCVLAFLAEKLQKPQVWSCRSSGPLLCRLLHTACQEGTGGCELTSGFSQQSCHCQYYLSSSC